MSINSNQVKWTPIIPSDPAQNIPVSQSNPALLKSTVTQASNIREVYPKRKSGTTQIIKEQVANNSNVVLYTVTAGKTLYITAARIGALALAAGYQYLYIANAAGVYQYSIFLYTSTTTNDPAPSISFPIPIEIPADWIIRVASTAAGLIVYATIFGWEE